MNLAQFFQKYNKKYLDYDNSEGFQCVDVIKAYFQEVLDMPPFKGNAIDYWTDIPGFQRVKNSWFAAPDPGDIVVWNTKVNPHGHVAICNWSRLFDFGAFEQNYPVGSPCHFQDHNYKNVIGWLKPPSEPKTPLKIAFIGENLPLGEDFVANVRKYSGGKISCVINEKSTDLKKYDGVITQDDAYAIVEDLNPKEKFIFIFYPPAPSSVFYTTYYFPKRNCCITTCPGTDARLLTYEFAHQLQYWYNANRGTRNPVQVVDFWPPTDELIKSKFDSVSWFYQPSP